MERLEEPARFVFSLLRKFGLDIDEDAPPQNIEQALALLKIILNSRTAWRPEAFAWKNSVSPSFIYNEIRDKRLRASKAADGVPLITQQAETDWLTAMPLLGASKDVTEPVNDDGKKSITEVSE
jgi:hypothetical protein